LREKEVELHGSRGQGTDKPGQHAHARADCRFRTSAPLPMSLFGSLPRRPRDKAAGGARAPRCLSLTARPLGARLGGGLRASEDTAAAQHPGLCNSRHWFRTATQRVSIRTLHTAPAWRGDASVPRQSLHLKQANYASEHPLKTSTGFGSLGSVAQTPRTKQHCGLLFPTGLAPSRTFRLVPSATLTPSGGGGRGGPHPTPPPPGHTGTHATLPRRPGGAVAWCSTAAQSSPEGRDLCLGTHTPRAPPLSAN
jgi:hypothetical protein